ncbi:HNH endonuclease [Bacillus sp. JJ1764]|uniref:HNH endonuclease n=1 Tax=Bacillus sp. JJ1764 TaxID=3122964 RepID=UPI002FFE31F2
MNKHKIREEVFEGDIHRCTYCGTELSSNSFQVDHIIPRSVGGKDTIDNLVLSCTNCNNYKADKNFKDFLSKLVVENLNT